MVQHRDLRGIQPQGSALSNEGNADTLLAQVLKPFQRFVQAVHGLAFCAAGPDGFSDFFL